MASLGLGEGSLGSRGLRPPWELRGEQGRPAGGQGSFTAGRGGVKHCFLTASMLYTASDLLAIDSNVPGRAGIALYVAQCIKQQNVSFINTDFSLT